MENNFSKLSPAYLIGRIVYPNRAPWEQKRKGAYLLVTLIFAAIVGIGFARYLLRSNGIHR